MGNIDSGDQIFNRTARRRGAPQGPEGIEDTEGHVAGDQVFDRRRPPVMNAPDEAEDTEGHTFRTYPGAAPDDDLDCRMPLPGEEDERMRRL